MVHLSEQRVQDVVEHGPSEESDPRTTSLDCQPISPPNEPMWSRTERLPRLGVFKALPVHAWKQDEPFRTHAPLRDAGWVPHGHGHLIHARSLIASDQAALGQ